MPEKFKEEPSNRGRDQESAEGELEDTDACDVSGGFGFVQSGPNPARPHLVPPGCVRKGAGGDPRSDEAIAEELHGRLADNRVVDVREVEVAVDHGQVRLTGQVATRWARHLVEDIAAEVAGVQAIDNELRIARGGASPANST